MFSSPLILHWQLPNSIFRSHKTEALGVSKRRFVSSASVSTSLYSTFPTYSVSFLAAEPQLVFRDANIVLFYTCCVLFTGVRRTLFCITPLLQWIVDLWYCFVFCCVFFCAPCIFLSLSFTLLCFTSALRCHDSRFITYAASARLSTLSRNPYICTSNGAITGNSAPVFQLDAVVQWTDTLRPGLWTLTDRRKSWFHWLILAKHNTHLYLRMSRRNWRQFVALHVSKLASGSGGSEIGHNVTLPAPGNRLNFALLQVLLDRRSSRKKRAWHRSHFTENVPHLCTTKCQCFSWLTGLTVDVN